jgi:hypothetical protein
MMTNEHAPQTPAQPAQPATPSKQTQSIREMLLPLIAALLMGFGVTLLFISGAYIQDIETLQRVPESVWLFVCGVPTQDPTILPLLVTSAIVALVLAVVLIVVDKTMPSVRTRLAGNQT